MTPLASIIGSGFLISGPLLAREFGGAAIGAMAVLLLLAYLVGWVVRWNIAHVEPHLATAATHDPVAWLARVTQLVLAGSYAVSVAYYLKLLAEFVLTRVAVPDASHAWISNVAVTALIVAIAATALIGGQRRVEHVAHGSVSVKLGIIAGLLVALALWWGIDATPGQPLPPVLLSWRSVPMLLGLLITVQGFETSRYLGASYPPDLRIRTMRQAQWIASGIYFGFVALLTPVLARAADAEGVAGIVDIFAMLAAPLAYFVLAGAVASQLSAAVADSIGSAGLLAEVSNRRLAVPVAFAASSALAVAVVWLTDPFGVVAVASRAFGLFYALQCAMAVIVARRDRVGGPWRQAAFVAIGLICLAAAAAGAPAEG